MRRLPPDWVIIDFGVRKTCTITNPTSFRKNKRQEAQISHNRGKPRLERLRRKSTGFAGKCRRSAPTRPAAPASGDSCPSVDVVHIYFCPPKSRNSPLGRFEFLRSNGRHIWNMPLGRNFDFKGTKPQVPEEFFLPLCIIVSVGEFDRDSVAELFSDIASFSHVKHHVDIGGSCRIIRIHDTHFVCWMF